MATAKNGGALFYVNAATPNGLSTRKVDGSNEKNKHPRRRSFLKCQF